MPVFNLQIEFDDKGAAVAIRNLNNIAGAARQTALATTKAGNEISNAVRSAVKSLGTLAGAFKAVEKTADFVKRGIDFNSSFEKNKIGFASLITSMTTLKNEQGKTLEGAEKYAAAQGVAADLMERIQNLGLKTTATTQELVEGVQSIMGPALQAGMALEDIPKFAVNGAQAMQTLGIPLNQMRTELEALLSGNVNKSQDILAPKLFSDVQGDLGEYIKKLRTSGKLLSELEKRLKPFELASEDVGKTWGALVSNLEDAYSQIAGMAGSGFLKSMKDSISQISNMMLDTGGDKAKVARNFEGILNVLYKVENALGDGVESAIISIIKKVDELGAHINKIGADRFLSDMGNDSIVAASTLAAFLGAKKAARAVYTVGEGDQTKQVAGLRQYIAAQHDEIKAIKAKAAAELEAARQANLSAQADLNRVKAAQATAIAVRDATQAEIIRQANQKQIAALTNAAAAAETRYQAAVRASSAASLSSRAIEAGINGVTNGVKSLIGMLGGPWGLAFTAATYGIMSYMTKTNEAQEATKAFEKAQKDTTTALEATEKALNKGDAELSKYAENAKRIAKESNEKSLKAYQNQIQDIIDNIPTVENSATNDWWGLADFDKSVPEKYKQSLQEIFDKFNAGAIDAKQFKEEISGLSIATKDAGYKNTDFVRTLDEFLSKDGVVNKLVEIARALGLVADEAGNAASNVNVFNNTANIISGNLKTGIEKFNFDSYAAGLGKKGKYVANALRGVGLDLEQTKNAIAGNAVEGIESKELKAFIDKAEEAYAANEKLSKSSGGVASKIASAKESIRRIRDEIAQLNGNAEKASGGVNKKIVEIETLGKKAGLSSLEIQKLANEYKSAFGKQAFNDLDKKIAQITNDKQTLKQIETNEELDIWRDKFTAAGLSAAEAEPKIKKLQEALNQQTKFENLQASLDFLKEIESLSGSYGASLEMQNQLIELQAEMYRGNLSPEMHGYVSEWERLQKLQKSQSGWNGAIRGAMKFGAEYGNLAAQVESLTMQMGSTIGNSLADGFMRGKFSAQDFFNSLMGLAAQAASNYFIGMIFKGMGGFFGDGGSGYHQVGYTFAGPGGGFTGPVVAPNALGGIYSGSGISAYSGQIVDTPTLFAYDRQVSKFARGAGIMGEAGPEAIMPLARARDGSLGVRLAGGDTSGTGINLAPVINIEIINQTGKEVSAETQQRQNGSGGMDLQIILQEVDRGMTSLAKSGKSAFAGYMEKSYGMNRAIMLHRSKA